MIIVTGGAGFIGSNLVHALCARGRRDVVVVDDLEQGDKFRNLRGAPIADYLDIADFEDRIQRQDPSLDRVQAVLHQGACADTTCSDGRYMMQRNYESSKRAFALCERLGVPLIYASSAAVYGGSDGFSEDPSCERPLNVYGYSKWLFDEWVRRRDPVAQVVGLRYFNVYGPREDHKARMASVAWHLHHQLLGTGQVRLFEGSDGYGDGGQRRDFVHVDDVVATILWFLDHPESSGIFNVGTGTAAPFNAIATAVLGFHGRGELRYIPFPDDLRGKYQSFTQADLSRLRATGCDVRFRGVDEGVRAYLAVLAAC